jgi:hypothetical protein
MTTDDTLFAHPADIPARPYAGSSGWSGSETSRSRAERADASGTTGERDRRTLALLRAAGSHGVTWPELADADLLHHGEASAVLSRLHKVGTLVRLKEQRQRCQVYVLPEYADGRETSAFRPNVSRKKVSDLLADIDRKLAVNNIIDARRLIREALRTYEV